MGLLLAGDQQAKIRTDAGRFSGSEGEAQAIGHDPVSRSGCVILAQAEMKKPGAVPGFEGIQADLQLDLHIGFIADLAQPGLQFFVVLAVA
ncbi:hypothetical protein Pstr01_43250 [Pseudomonas straminea]|nr:hypothetical protein Pstr01_43250 [Pseudomonas straminea]